MLYEKINLDFNNQGINKKQLKTLFQIHQAKLIAISLNNL